MSLNYSGKYGSFDHNRAENTLNYVILFRRFNVLRVTTVLLAGSRPPATPWPPLPGPATACEAGPPAIPKNEKSQKKQQFTLFE